MEEIMLGTRDLPNLKKPLSATLSKFDESQMSSPTPSSGKSSVSTASTMAMSERSPGPFQSSTLQDDDDIPRAPVLLTSSSQSEVISPLPTPLTSPVVPPPPASGSSPTSSPGVLSRKSRSRRVQAHGKIASSTRRSVRGARSLSDRRLQQMRTQRNHTSDPSMIPPAPSLETIESGVVQVSPSTNSPTAAKAPKQSKSPVSRRRGSVRDSRSISDKKLQQLLSTQHKQVSDPSIVSAPPLGTNARTASKSPVPRKRGSVRAARSISDRRLQQLNAQHAQVSDPSIVSAPPLEAKQDDKIAPRSRARQSKSPVPRKRGSVRGARISSISDPKVPKTSTQPEQVGDTSISSTPPVETKEGDEEEDDLLVVASRSASLRENGKKTRKRSNNRNSMRPLPLSNDDSAKGTKGEGKQYDLSLSLSSRGTVSSTKEASASTRSSSSHSLPTLQSKRAADRSRRRRLRESMQRSRSGTAIASSEPKHPGFIKSFLGTSENGALAEDDIVPMTLRKGDKAIRSGPV